MASIHRIKDSKNWHAAFYLPDGRRAQRSTGTSDKKKAMQIAFEYEKASALGKEGRLTDQKAREVIASIYTVANQDLMPVSNVEDYLERWLKVKTIETKENTVAEYTKTAERLKASLGPKAKRPMDAVTVSDALRFRDGIAGILSPATANKYLKIARVVWNDAGRDSMASDNPFAKVKILDAEKGSRKGFTLIQVKTLLSIAPDSWRGMILLGFYIGQRIGDIARLTWQNIDLHKEEIRLTTTKTGRDMVIPMARPLVEYFTHLPATDNPSSPVFPDLAELRTETLSGQFSAIVADAGYGTYDKNKKAKKEGLGRGARRATGNLTFHSLRHTATSALKNAGVSEAVAMEIIGHDSEAMSRHYTKIETKTLRRAIHSLPDITTKAKAVK
jgi:integrase